jgi:predicted MFS family arabinose efflux permease
MELCARQFALTLRACFAVIFGMVMDHSEPRLVFWLVAILSLVTLISVFGTGRHAGAGRIAAGAD